MGKGIATWALALALVVGLCPGMALAAPDQSASNDKAIVLTTQTSTAPQQSEASDGADLVLTTQASTASLAKKATKLMKALPKASKIKLTHSKKTAAAFAAADKATSNWTAFNKLGKSTKKAFLNAFNNKFMPAKKALDKLIKSTTTKAKKAQVKGVKAAAGKQSATVSWKKLGAGYKYAVYYSTSKSSGFKKAGNTASTKMTVSKLTSGKQYYFKVRAYRTDIPESPLVADMYKTVNGKYSSVVTCKAQ